MLSLAEDKGQFEAVFPVRGRNFTDAGQVSGRIKNILREKALPEDIVRRAAIVIFEAEVNIISYAEKGIIRYSTTPDSLIIEAIDEGPGIADIELALQEGYSTADDIIRELGFGAGMGLANIKKYSGEFEISSEVGKGTRLKSIIKITWGI